jgi:Asp-tRNA(Asn)/Glu-tRNA(Gln) amidotransferase A subunit family amidase
LANTTQSTMTVTDAQADAWLAGLEAQRKGIAAAQDHWKAFVTWMSAEEVQALRSQAAARLNGVLQGAAVAVKDIFDTKHLATEYGSPIYKGHRPSTPSAVVQSIERAGGVVLGKSVTTEFAFLEPPPTRNPRAALHTPGGSSSGSAAAIAAGLVRFAVGTQTGGSVIRPASYCGIVGYKPSFGLINSAGLKPFSSSLDTVGLFASNAADCALFARALIPLLTLPAPALDPDAKAGALRFGLIRDYPWGPPSAEYQQEIERVVTHLKANGVEVIDVQLPTLIQEVYEAHAIVQGYEAWRALAHEMDTQPQNLSALLRSYLQEQAGITAAQYHQGLLSFEAGRAWADQAFKGFDGILGASAPDVAPLPDNTGSSSFNRVWTALGVPAITLPIPRKATLNKQALPLGLQVLGARYKDDALLDSALSLEALLASMV